jgi:hypothetical protein
MRKKRQEQLSLFHAFGSNDIAKKLIEISLVLDANHHQVKKSPLFFRLIRTSLSKRIVKLTSVIK